MKCGFENSLSSQYFGNNNQQVAGNNPMKNGQLSYGVVAPPDKLPNASLHDTIYSNEAPKTIKDNKIGGTVKFTAGKLSAGLAILAGILSAVSFLPFIRKH